MKKLVFLILLSISFSFGNIILGVSNSKYAFVRYESSSFWGGHFKQSILQQYPELQYGELGADFFLSLDNAIDFRTSPYFGLRYDGAYFCAGNKISVLWRRPSVLNVYLEIDPHYDSELGYNTFLESQLRLFITPHIGIVGGAKNSPEFRLPEARWFAGLLLNDEHSAILPYISVPLDPEQKHSIRFNLNFEYSI